MGDSFARIVVFFKIGLVQGGFPNSCRKICSFFCEGFQDEFSLRFRLIADRCELAVEAVFGAFLSLGYEVVFQVDGLAGFPG